MSANWLKMLAAAGVTATLAGNPAAAAAAGEAPAPRYSALVVLGDSLSDGGNAGRFTDGPVWVELLAAELELRLAPSSAGGGNHAVGGARLHGGAQSLRVQADRHLAAAGRADPDALHVVYGGGNDLLAAPWASNRATLVADAVASLRAILDGLSGRGAVHFLVPNLPDIGMAPQVSTFGPAVASLGRALTLDFNRRLAAALDGFEADRRRAGRPVVLHRLDVFRLGEQVMADPAAAGFRNVATPCPTRSGCDGYLFWDGLHPTAAAHARLAAAALEVLRRDAAGQGGGMRAAR